MGQDSQGPKQGGRRRYRHIFSERVLDDGPGRDHDFIQGAFFTHATRGLVPRHQE